MASTGKRMRSTAMPPTARVSVGAKPGDASATVMRAEVYDGGFEHGRTPQSNSTAARESGGPLPWATDRRGG